MFGGDAGTSPGERPHDVIAGESPARRDLAGTRLNGGYVINITLKGRFSSGLGTLEYFHPLTGTQ